MSDLPPIRQKIAVDTTDYKTGAAEINRNIRLIDSGFKASAAALGDWSKTSEGMNLRMKTLNDLIALQQKKVEATRREYERLKAEKGENSRAAQDLQIKVNKEVEALNKLQSELGQTASSLNKMKASTGGAGGAFKSFGSNLKQLGQEVPALGTAINLMTNPMALFGTGLTNAASAAKKAIAAASDLNETTSKTSVVFGDAAARVIEFGKNAATGMGMSENAALTAAATYGNLFRSMGMAEGKSAEMSTRLVQLAADLGSFNNMDPSEVMDKLRSGLTGEAEPLKSLGININEASLKQKALNLGLWDGIGALDASAKAQAAYALMLEQTRLAQGDFIKTSDGLANQQKILAAQWEDLKAEAGKAMAPALTTVVRCVNDVIKAENLLNEAYKKGTITKAEAVAEIYKVEFGLKKLTDVELELRAKTEGVTVAVIEAQDATDRWKNKIEDVIPPVEKAAEVSEPLAIAQYDVNSAMREGRPVAQSYAGAVADVGAKLDAAKIATEKFDTATDTLVNDAIGSLGENLAQKTVMLAAYNLAMGNITQEEYDATVAMAPWLINLEELGKLADDGKISWEDYYKALEDGKVTREEIIEALIAAGMSAKDARDYVNGLHTALDNLHDKDLTIKVNYEQYGEEPPGGTINQQDIYDTGPDDVVIGGKGAHGLDIVVPSGFNHDNFAVLASSGERVTITPPGKASGGNTYIELGGITVNAPGGDLVAVAQATRQGVIQALRASGISGV